MLDVVRIVLRLAITVFSAMMWGRLILDWILVFARSWKPKGVLLVLCEAIYTITDPPLKLVRKVIPPLRVGDVSLDLAWIVVMVALSFLGTLVMFIR
ncbi:YggT family protein [Pseudoclavibacter albus]|uniref:YggT family protein n=1 Tax=Pseudoclavibacter albus TaxID=272241 RepID=UPI000825FA73|nr:YggT family protein [Pseudoclavibacter alba]